MNENTAEKDAEINRLTSYVAALKAGLRAAGELQARDEHSLINARAEIARLLRREPSRDEMLRALGDTAETCYEGWTVRRCIDCGVPVAGGPTHCMLCVGRIEGYEKRQTEINELRALIPVMTRITQNLATRPKLNVTVLVDLLPDEEEAGRCGLACCHRFAENSRSFGWWYDIRTLRTYDVRNGDKWMYIPEVQS